jgi:hypothetical protein
MLVGLAPKVSEDNEFIVILYRINEKPVPECGYEREYSDTGFLGKLYHLRDFYIFI